MNGIILNRLIKSIKLYNYRFIPVLFELICKSLIFWVLVFQVAIIKAQKPELIIPTKHSGINSLNFSPDGQYVISGSDDTTIKLWDVKTGKEIRPFKGHTSWVESICFSPNGKYIISGSNDKTIKIWEVQTGKETKTLLGHTSQVTTVCFSPDGNYVLSGSKDKTIKIWELSSGKILFSLNGHSSSITSAFFSPDGQYVISCSDDTTIKLWDFKTGKEIRSYKGHSYSVTSVCASQDGQYLLSGSSVDNTVILWESQSGRKIRSIKGHGGSLISVSFSSNGLDIRSYHLDSEVNVWDFHTGEEKRSFELRPRILSSHNSSHLLSAVCSSPDGKYVLSGYRDGLIILNDLHDAKEIQSFNGHNSWVENVCFSSDEKHILSQLRNEKSILNLFEINSAKEMISFGHGTAGSYPLCLSTDGHYALTGSDDGVINVWDTQKPSRLSSFKGHSSKISTGSFSLDGRYFLTASKDIRLWDFRTREEIRLFLGDTSTINSLNFSPDGRSIISASKDSIKLWDVETGDKVHSFEGHNWSINQVCFSSDGSMALSCSSDGYIKIWDVKTGKEIHSIDENADVRINTVCFSPNARFLLSGDFRGRIKLWDVPKGNLIRQLTATQIQHNYGINSVGFLSGGDIAFSSSIDIPLKLWNVQDGKEIATLFFVDSIDWIVITPSGLFDASVGAMKLMHFVVGTEVIEFDQLKDRYWQPGLLPILMGFHDERLRHIPPIDNIKLYPEKKLALNDDELTIHLKNRGGGIGKVGVFIDDIELIEDARLSPLDSTKDNLLIKIDMNLYKDKLYYNNLNIIKVIVWNSDGYIASRPDTIHYFPYTKDEKGNSNGKIIESYKENPALWAVVIGTSDYRGKEIDLRFAAKDASDFAKALYLGSSNLFGEDSLNIKVLTTDDISPLPDKLTIREEFRKLEKSKPKDVVVIYFSGHGLNGRGQDGDFYYLTMDATNLSVEQLNDPFFNHHTISSTEITSWINAIPARKKVLILDACSSGRAADEISTAMNLSRNIPSSQTRALDRMRDRTGFYILAGSFNDKETYESSLYGQGLLTYALLRGIKGESLRRDGAEDYIDIKKLFQYVEDIVPSLAENIGGIQKPFSRGIQDRGSFDIGRMTAEDKEKIVVTEKKPVFINSDVKPADIMSVDLKLDKIINGKLADITAKGKTAPLFYSEGEYPEAYFIRGRYNITGDKITLEYILVKYVDGAEEIKIRKQIITENILNLSILADNVLRNIEKLIY